MLASVVMLFCGCGGQMARVHFVCQTCYDTHNISCSSCDGRGIYLCDECGGLYELLCTKCLGLGSVECFLCDGDGNSMCMSCLGFVFIDFFFIDDIREHYNLPHHGSLIFVRNLRFFYILASRKLKIPRFYEFSSPPSVQDAFIAAVWAIQFARVASE